ncbi:enoyl-CoA hydratase [Roseomonas marmotae]|uniref:Enoyl-CoA hydratase/isomerase family protein n=1 Tax=Roseomonas marmotae TaxID=2768161 RepID=A0ABS3KAR9_9PROT|nr:enoyl-CoA hydratase [Roseomonas marmotae]MBO1074566.1 enoyl-CoA hydratase/isomerase family protein [Roseomonas marmotae]QTI81597.1 enoyl-CoA hydratase/isomerase family protein [Roseomonas marmotae]
MPDTTLPPPGRILARQEAGIGWLTIDNLPRRNAISPEMWQALGDALVAFEADEAVRCIVLTGAGDRAFASGSDISRFEEGRTTLEQVAEHRARNQRVHDRLRQMDKPVIAMIRGHCIGGGLAIALSCDIRICSEDADFAVPAAKLGVGYELDGVRKLTQIVGPAFAKEIFFTGRRFSAAEACGMGLVNRVLPAEALESFVTETARGIAANAPLTIRASKHIIMESMKGQPDEARCDRLYQDCFESEDYKEGRRAFMEKRPPQFRGR